MMELSGKQLEQNGSSPCSSFFSFDVFLEPNRFRDMNMHLVSLQYLSYPNTGFQSMEFGTEASLFLLSVSKDGERTIRLIMH